MAESPKVAVLATTASAVTGISAHMEVISGLLGIIATTAAITLSCVLIVTHIRKSRLECRVLKKRLADED